jgi:hypothetical protein
MCINPPRSTEAKPALTASLTSGVLDNKVVLAMPRKRNHAYSGPQPHYSFRFRVEGSRWLLVHAPAIGGAEAPHHHHGVLDVLGKS